MAEMTITVNDAVVADLLDAIAFYHPIPETGGTPDYTKPQWGRKFVKDNLNKILNRYYNHLARVAAEVPLDETAVDVT